MSQISKFGRNLYMIKDKDLRRTGKPERAATSRVATIHLAKKMTARKVLEDAPSVNVGPFEM